MIVANVRGLSLALIPKVANSAMRVAILEGIGADDPDDHRHPALNIGPPTGFRAAFFRDPVDRAISCWSDKLTRRKAGSKGLEKRGFRVGMTFREFVDQVERCRDDDPHTRAQARSIPDRLEFMGRVEDWPLLQERFPWLAPLRRRNAAPRQGFECPDDLRARIEAIYDCDMVIWRSL